MRNSKIIQITPETRQRVSCSLEGAHRGSEDHRKTRAAIGSRRDRCHKFGFIFAKDTPYSIIRTIFKYSMQNIRQHSTVLHARNNNW